MVSAFEPKYPSYGLIHVKPEVTGYHPSKSWGGGHHIHYSSCLEGCMRLEKNIGFAPKSGRKGVHNDVFAKTPLYGHFILDI